MPTREVTLELEQVDGVRGLAWGDWDGDGCDSLGVYRRGAVFLRNTLDTGVPTSSTTSALREIDP